MALCCLCTQQLERAARLLLQYTATAPRVRTEKTTPVEVNKACVNACVLEQQLDGRPGWGLAPLRSTEQLITDVHNYPAALDFHNYPAAAGCAMRADDDDGVSSRAGEAVCGSAGGENAATPPRHQGSARPRRRGLHRRGGGRERFQPLGPCKSNKNPSSMRGFAGR